MKQTLLAFALIASVSAPALAQTTITTREPTASVVIAPEQRARIKEYIVQRRVAPAVTQQRFVVGTVVPSDVDLNAVPEDWGPAVTSYGYFYANDRVVFVEPGTRRIVQILD